MGNTLGRENHGRALLSAVGNGNTTMVQQVSRHRITMYSSFDTDAKTVPKPPLAIPRLHLPILPALCPQILDECAELAFYTPLYSRRTPCFVAAGWSLPPTYHCFCLTLPASAYCWSTCPSQHVTSMLLTC